MSVLSTLIVALLCIIFVLWLVSRLILSVPDLRRFDQIDAPIYDSHPDEPRYRKAAFERLSTMRSQLKRSGSIKQALLIGRDYADQLSSDLQTESTLIRVNQDGIDAEWIIAPNADTKRRILYLHGGAFLVGSAQGHRNITDKLAKLANAAVLSLNYRMLPEHGRLSGVADAQNAYQWLLKNGPYGPEALDYLIIGGDSAGGNLALMISSWSKNATYKPNAVVSFSPVTDFSFRSPTIKKNRTTDPILGLGLGVIAKIPFGLRNWLSFIVCRANPANPLISPVLGDLSNLPRTLILASTSEMLLGDAIRYTNMANAASSDVELKLWKDQIHDWPLFFGDCEASADAWLKVGEFLDSLA